MDSLFGLSMNIIMWVLLGILGLAVSVVLYVVLRSRVMFLMGVRNMPRRMAQTTLIIVGLMLSTLIITAAFTTGDTVDRSLTAQGFSMLGHIDEWIQLEAEREGPPREIDSTIPQSLNTRLREAIEADPDAKIDGYLPILRSDVPIVNPRSRQSEPIVNFVGLDSASLDGFPDVIDAQSGELLDVASLAADEAFMNESAADALDTEVGDTIQIFVQSEPYDFTIMAIVEDKVVTGIGDFDAKEGLVTRLDTLQGLLGQPGEVNFIAISNEGGVRSGLDLTADVIASLDAAILDASFERAALEVYDVKRDLIGDFELAGNIMTTFFLIFGLFSIASGMLLIVMIFVMLAAERRSELGMARAIGTRRGHLVQMFLSEGMAYNMLAAMVGVGMGVLVAVGIANVMGRIFGDFFDIEPHVTARSLVISYSLGVSLSFLTVTFASWRVSNLNIVAAIRDLDEVSVPNPEAGTIRGYLRGLLNATVAVVLAPISLFVMMLRGHTFGFPAPERVYGERIPLWPFFVVPLAPFYLIALGVVALTRDRRPDGMSSWLVAAGILVPPLGLLLVALQDRRAMISWGAGLATLGMVGGAALILLGLNSDTAFPFALGFSLVTFGIAVVLTYFGLQARAAYTSAGLFLLLFWGFNAGNRLEGLFGTLDGGIEMFFLSGIVMVAASTFVLIYNADLVLAVVSRVGGRFGSILPAVKTAVAYPLQNRFRTGMTLAMISLVIFALTMMSTMNLNFGRIFLADSARGGWDVVVEENPNNPIEDLTVTLQEGGSSAPAAFEAVGKLQFAGESQVRELGLAVPTEFESYVVAGMSLGFIEASEIELGARASGFESDEAVWEALATRDDVAIIDRFAIGGNDGPLFGGADFSVTSIDDQADSFEPVTLEIQDTISGLRTQVELIGVMEIGPSASFFGLYVPEAAFERTFGDPFLSRHVVALEDPGKSKEIAREIEGSLLTIGAQADSLKQLIDDAQALQRNFFLLMQGFMGLGLFVGIAAVGVIAFRTVVERRQQIGMLRAIGYQRSTVALSFIIESSFVTLLGIGSGVALAIWLSYFLLTSDEFPVVDYVVPWRQIAFISGLAFLASLVMTYIPSRQAAGVPIAEALRYE
ncbi:MAG: FtsX-like permease family protein [Chloroflexi bacterium]|nr:FtsX-like permease family protein [Chloroflexota bacterium]